jgi:predicted RNA-binding protein with RPS1 domain
MFLIRQFGHLVPLGVGLHALHLGLVHISEQAKMFIKNILRNANLALTCFEKIL